MLRVLDTSKEDQWSTSKTTSVKHICWCRTSHS
jgi:hypothetical protein